MRNPKWFMFQEYIAQRLKCIDPYARSTKGSGNGGELCDVNNKYLLVEAKDTDKKSVTFKKDVWDDLISKLPLHSKRIPMYALQDGEKNKWAVLDLDDFLDIFIDYIYLKEKPNNA